MTASLLRSAGQAIQVLANLPSAESTQPTLESQKAAFVEHSSSYFDTLSSIEVRLRRQVYALEEAGLVAPGEERDAKRGRAFGSEEVHRAVGGGPLDSSWLNARVNKSVEEGMERELWSRARALAEKTQQGRAGTTGHHGDNGITTEEAMDVDDKVSHNL